MKIYFILRARAVVTWDVPPYMVVGGFSATPLKKVEEK
jgi:acetyltransferase-like isoleucine patch superfamily enzyme